ncbi:MAG: N-acetyltransferase [Nocardioidaceae bacterium]|jgi:predicted GNAT family acetyltransferase|nr:N-acetyltransferase [Nocardioidaceae bacterium]
MTYSVRDNTGQQRFEIVDEADDVLGFADYSPDDGVIAITHTEVMPEHGGKGVGTSLIVGTLDILRARDEQVLPVCPFVPAVIRDHPELLDLVPVDQRVRFGLPDAPEPG